MSGLVGALSRTGESIDRATMDDMLGAIAHRGPEGRAVWTEGTVGLGYAKLTITPEASEGSMPQTSADGTLVVTADARLDNRAELIDRLDVEAFDVVTAADLIFAAYRQWGQQCPERLIGAFAFVIWDSERNHLFCARDHVGLRPLYYHVGEERFLLGSEPAALFAAGGVSRAIDESYLADRLAGRHADLHSTVHLAIRRLEPGCTLTIDSRAATTRRYWPLDPEVELTFPSTTEGVAAFRERFAEAVRCRLRAPDPVGSNLTGDLGSSSVACSARTTLDRADRGSLHTYSVDLDRSIEVESQPTVDAVLETGGFEDHRLDAERIDPLADLEDRLDRVGGFFDPALQHPTYALVRRSTGDCRVLLDGTGWDRVVPAGLNRFAELLRAGKVRTLNRELGAFGDDRVDRWRLLREYILGPLVPPALSRRLLKGRIDDRIARANPTLSRSFAERTGLTERLAPEPGVPTVRHRQRRLLTDGTLTHVLELNDHMAAAMGVELRYPFLDRRLMEFCLALPAEYKLQNGWDHWVLRTAMASVLPAAVRWREDPTAPDPLSVEGLRHHPRIEALQSADVSSPLARYLDVGALHRVGAGREADGSAAEALVRAAVLDAWLGEAAV